MIPEGKKYAVWSSLMMLSSFRGRLPSEPTYGLV